MTEHSDTSLILLVEDDDLHADAILRAFENSKFGFRLIVVGTVKDALAVMALHKPSMVITDYLLSDGDGFGLMHAANGEFPFIIISGMGNEQVAVDAIKAGALDYIVKSVTAFKTLPFKVNHALQAWRHVVSGRNIDVAVRRGKRDWERTFDAVPDLISIIDINHNIIRVNRAMAKHFSLSPADLVGRKCCELVHGTVLPPTSCPVAEMTRDGLVHTREYNERIMDSFVDITVSPLLDDGGRITAYVHVMRDITDRKRAEEERSLMINVYNLLNKQSDPDEIITDIISLLKSFTAIEEISIRFQADDDFSGFELNRFSAAGSLWTNSTTASLFADTVETVSQTRTYIHCNGEGYESVALIPMNCAGQVFGVMQFNDSRPNCFTNELIDLFERVADILAVALSSKKSQQALQESELRFSQVSDQACELIWEVDINGRYTYVSKGCLAVTGYTQEELVGKMHFYDLHPEEGREAFKAAAFELFERKDCYNNVLNPVIAKNGDVHWVNSNGLPIIGADQKVLGYRGTDADVTKQKNLEERLLKQSLIYHELLETSHDLIWRSDTDGYFSYVNSAWKITGYQLEEIIGKKLTDFQAVETCERDGHDFLKLSVTTEIKAYETELISKMQEVIHVLINSNPLYDDNRNVIGVRGTAYDITASKKAEAERLALEAQFRQTQKLESLGVLAGGIAHDFNNILSIILGHCYIVNEDIESEIDQKTHVQQIEKAAGRAAELCRQMLSYAGKNALVQTRINMWLLVDDIVKMLKSAIKKNVKIELDLKYDVPEIRGDSAQIQQIVMNLIINAAEAIGNENGTISVSLNKVNIPVAPEHKDWFGNVIQAGKYACLMVSDNGCGMVLETQQRIFEPFYTTKSTGRGLGMSAVLGIIKSHDGSLQLSSKPGAGSTFTVYLPSPLFQDVAESGPTEIIASLPKGRGTILLVDDEEALRIIGCALLKAMSFSVITASNGHEALDIYCEQKSEIDLVLLDLIMPELDGFDTYFILRDKSPSIPIVICSGYCIDEILEVIENDPHAAVIQKPYKASNLQDIFMKLLDKQG